MTHTMFTLGCRILLGAVILSAILCGTAGAIGVGLAPTKIEMKDALRGGIYEKPVTVFNPGDSEIRIAVGAEGQVRDWISFYDFDDDTTPVREITVPAEENVPLMVRVTVPDDAANGAYNATLVAATLLNKPSGSVGAVIRASSALSVTVTDIQRLTGTVEYITVTDTEMDYPLPIRILFRNTGNVVAQPVITAAFSREGERVETITHTCPVVALGSSEIIVLEWDTTGERSGSYTGVVTVSLGGTVIEEEEISFELFPIGELTREGRLSSISCDGDLYTGSVVKIIGTFENTGTIETKAKLVGEVFRGDELVATISSEELNVPILTAKPLVSYLDLEETGEYRVMAHVVYEGKVTGDEALTLSVEDEPKAPEQQSPVGLLASFAAIGVASVFLGIKKYRKN